MKERIPRPAKEAERLGTTVDLSFPEMQAHVDPEAHGHWMEPYVLAALNAALGSVDGGGGEKKKKKRRTLSQLAGGRKQMASTITTTVKETTGFQH